MDMKEQREPLQIKEKGAATITEQNVYPVELTNCKSFC